MKDKGIEKKDSFKSSFRKELPLILMLLPGIILIFIFNYVPLFGIVMSFQKYVPAKGIFGSKWVGLDNFKYILEMPDIYRVFMNTLTIAVMKIIANLVVPVVFAILLNEIRKKGVKRSVQTMIYLPHFLSWVILGGIILDILSPSTGMVNKLLGAFGIEPIFFLGDNSWFPSVLVITDVWKNFGYGSIVYLAALTGIDPTLYEAARVDGAGRWKQMIHVTIPGIMPIVIMMSVLSLGNVLNGGFEQVYNLYSPIVYESGDILDTMVYRLGLEDGNYSVSTAVGLFKSAVSLILVTISYRAAYRYGGYRIF